eukprot:2081842-Rhodomonas_salina.1
MLVANTRLSSPRHTTNRPFRIAGVGSNEGGWFKSSTFTVRRAGPYVSIPPLAMVPSSFRSTSNVKLPILDTSMQKYKVPLLSMCGPGLPGCGPSTNRVSFEELTTVKMKESSWARSSSRSSKDCRMSATNPGSTNGTDCPF